MTDSKFKNQETPNREFDPLVLTMEEIKLKYSTRSKEVLEVLQFFGNKHLNSNVQSITRPCVRLAFSMMDYIDDSAELVDGLRSLLKAKDSFVRSFLISGN